MFDLDGSNLRTVAPLAASGVRWDPTGHQIAFAGLGDQIATTDTAGNYRVAAASTQAASILYGPQYSADGQWLYYTADDHGVNPNVWRVRPTDSTTAVKFLNLEDEGEPSPSPDGTRVAMVAVFTPYQLQIYSIGAGTLANTGAFNGVGPVWGPSGDAIAYVPLFNNAVYQSVAGLGPIQLVNADGSGHRVVGSPTALYSDGFSWSPDGQWIVAANQVTGLLDLIDVATDSTLPLGYTRPFFSPSWRPAVGAGGAASVINGARTAVTRSPLHRPIAPRGLR
jgi:Tol biopolymer transport system component